MEKYTNINFDTGQDKTKWQLVWIITISVLTLVGQDKNGGNKYSEDICLQTLTSFSLTRAKSLVRVVGRSSFELVKSFTHRRISNPIFDRCRYSDFLETLTVKHYPDILTFLQVSG